MRTLRTVSAVAVMLLPLAAAGAEPRLEGRTIASVAWDADGPVDGAEIVRLVELRAGRPLDEDAVRRSVQNLYATERFANVEVDGEPVPPDRVAVTVHLFRAYRVGSIRFENRPVSADALRRALGFAVGGPYQEPEIREGIGRIERFLATEGFSQAAVTAGTEFDRARFEARVIYRIAPGRPTRLVAPIFDGDPSPFSPAKLIAVSKLKSGDRYREERARKAAEAIQDFLVAEGRLKAEVRLIGVETHGDTAAPVFRVEIGPPIVFETVGVEEKKVRRDFANLLKNQVFQEDLLIRYVATLRRRYQEAGYHEAKVDYTIDDKGTPITVTLTVQRGPKEYVSSIVLEGVHGFPESRIRALLLTRPRSLLHRGRLVDAVLADDRTAIEGFYRVHGYTEAATVPPRIAPGPKAGAMVVTLAVAEGPRTEVRSSDLDGVTFGDRTALRRKLTLRPGGAYSAQKAADDRAEILAWYRDRGWTSAGVETRVALTPDRSLADVTQLVREGPREFFGKTIVRGNARTLTSRILLPVSWEEGEPFSETKLLDAQRDISRTGVFQKVDARRALPDPSTPERNVLIDVVPGRPLSLLYGAGYQYEAETGEQSPYVLFGIGYNNLFGSLRSISLESRYAPETNRGRVFLNYRDPFFFGAEVPLVASIFYAREPIQKIDIRRQGAFIEATRQLTGRVRVGLRYEFQRISTGNTDRLELQTIQPFDRDIAEQTVGATLLYDTRDEIIDPHRGLFFSAFAKKAFPSNLLAADARYVKAYAQLSGYVPLLGGVLAGSVRAGKGWVGGGCVIGGVSTSSASCIPIAERFFAGGRTSNRGFGYAVEGISDETVDYSVIEVPVKAGDEGRGTCRGIDPEGGANFNCDFGPRVVGGSSIAGFNVEWRFPIAGNFGGQLFYDATQVWGDGSFHLGIEGDRGLRQTVGFGVRYLTPVGPLRFEFGRVLHPRTIDAPLLLFDRATGNTDPIDHRTVVQKEPTYKLFLSIGYAF
ncbi:MAG TPA: POTRA domain-containing protein [Thermoanaerobaculia bacterium]|nr:POTRA domain-containing protein [Thermoanaerobaculia bacterium]